MTVVGGQPEKKTMTASYKATKHYERTFVISDYYWLYLSSHLPPPNIMTGVGVPVSKPRGYQKNIIAISYSIIIVMVCFVTLSPLGCLAKFQRDWGSVGVA